jgi:hypothetical protein
LRRTVGIDNTDTHLTPIENKVAATNPPGYFPTIPGGGRLATRCPAGMDCANQSAVPTCSTEDVRYPASLPSPMASATPVPQKGNCMVTVLDHYTTSFNYSETNLAAIWLRPQWYLFLNSAITDVLNGALTFVTGGGFTRSALAVRPHRRVTICRDQNRATHRNLPSIDLFRNRGTRERAAITRPADVLPSQSGL